MTRRHLIPTLVALAAGMAAVLIVLFCWQLPPFAPADPRTENAYVRGQVTQLAPQLAGHVSAVEVADFQQVRRGQVIARLDDRPFRQRLAQARASLAGAEAGLQIGQQAVRSAEAGLQSARATRNAAEAARDTARAAWDRARQLKSRGVTADSAADQTELALRQAEAALAQAESALAVAREQVSAAKVGLLARQADIDAARAAVELATLDLDHTVIRAPGDGRLGQVAVHPGQYVAPGTPLVSLVGPEVWVIANFRETEWRRIRPGAAAVIRVDALRGGSLRGHVQAFSPAMASEFSLMPPANATGNFTKVAQRLPVRIALDPDQDLAPMLEPGMSAVVTVARPVDGGAAG